MNIATWQRDGGAGRAVSRPGASLSRNRDGKAERASATAAARFMSESGLVD